MPLINEEESRVPVVASQNVSESDLRDSIEATDDVVIHNKTLCSKSKVM